MSWRRGFMAAAALIGLAAVASAALVRVVPSDREPARPTSGVLDGRTYVATGFVGQRLLAGSELNLSFAAGLISFSSGCNDFEAGYVLRDGRMELVEPTHTLAGCSLERERQDAWIAELIEGADVQRVGDQLVLRHGDSAIILRTASDPAAPGALVGRGWMLLRLQGPSGLAERLSTAPGSGPAPSIRISDTVADVVTPCRYGTLAVRRDAEALVFTRVRPWDRRRAPHCGPVRARRDAVMRAVLEGRVAVARRGDRLTITRGAARLTFVDARSVR